MPSIAGAPTRPHGIAGAPTRPHGLMPFLLSYYFW